MIKKMFAVERDVDLSAHAHQDLQKAKRCVGHGIGAVYFDCFLVVEECEGAWIVSCAKRDVPESNAILCAPRAAVCVDFNSTIAGTTNVILGLCVLCGPACGSIALMMTKGNILQIKE